MPLLFPPVPGRRRIVISPQTTMSGSGFLFELTERLIGRIAAVPPRETSSHKLAVKRSAIRQSYICDEASILITIYRANSYYSVEGLIAGELLRAPAKGLPL